VYVRVSSAPERNDPVECNRWSHSAALSSHKGEIIISWNGSVGTSVTSIRR